MGTRISREITDDDYIFASMAENPCRACNKTRPREDKGEFCSDECEIKFWGKLIT
jgi:hypothetical protein